MLRLVYGQNEIVSRWVADHIPGCFRGWPNATAIGIADENGLIGGSVFHAWNPESGVIEISAASVRPNWLSRRMINAMFSYAFDQIQCQLVVMRTSENNASVLNIWDALGFDRYTIPRLRGRNEAECILCLTEEDWRSSKFHRKDQ